MSDETKAAKAKRPTGRPRTITPELERRVFDAIAGGVSVKEACATCGVSFASYQRLWAADEGFRTRSARAYLHGTIFYLSNAEHRLESATADTIQVAREIAHHARWRASRLIPAFSDKLAVGITDSDGFFGTKPQEKTVIDMTDPRQSWARKKAHEWDSRERIEASRMLAFAVVDMGVTLRDVGLGEQFYDALRLVSVEVSAAVRNGGTPPPARQSLPAPATTPAPAAVPEPVVEREPPRQGYIIESAEAELAEALRVERRQERAAERDRQFTPSLSARRWRRG